MIHLIILTFASCTIGTLLLIGALTPWDNTPRRPR